MNAIARRAAWLAALSIVALIVAGSTPEVSSGLELSKFQGHAAVGYGVLMAADAPGGSLSAAGGVEYPVASQLSAGIEIGYWLLGTRLVESGTVSGELNYSAFEATALARWRSTRFPLEITAGPGVFNARSDLTSAAPSYFSDLAIGETVGGAAVGVTVIQRRPSPVRVGAEFAARHLWLSSDNWTLMAVRLVIHY